MPEKIISPDAKLGRNLLDTLWKQILEGLEIEPDPEIDRLIDSRFVSIRFCLPTQILGKLTDPKLDCLCLQKGSGEIDAMWDPRSFASKVIAPWVAENQNVLGTSTDPYVSKPLRTPRLAKTPGNVKGKEEWELLYNVLDRIQTQCDEDFTRRRMLQTLDSIHRKLADLNFEYYIPERISIEQLVEIVNKFLSENSGGDRGLSVAAAFFETIGKYFGLYKDIRRFVINASDKSTGSVGDIECYNEEGELRLAVEVKERNLSLTDVKSSIQKTRKESVKEFLFNSPGLNPTEKEQILESISKAWASGTNIYHLSIEELIQVGLSLTGESGRKFFLKNVGIQLNTYNTQPANRKRWKELLEEI